MGYKIVNFKSGVLTAALIVPIYTLVLLNIDLLLSASVAWDKQFDKQTMDQENQDTIFDFIIVGAGSAGSIIASRLSENASIKVLVLEAGGEPSPVLSVPTLAYLLNNQKSHDWAYRTVPQKKAAKALVNQVSYWPAGRTLGGSSQINGLINIRGNVQGFDLMANRTGDSLWRLENILKYYRKIENYRGWFNKEHHGQDGHTTIEYPTLVPFTKHFVKAGEELGYPIRDPNKNGPYSDGFSPVEYYLKDGKRSDIYTSLLKPLLFLRKSNLILRKFSHVTRLIFQNGTDNRVDGVEYMRHGVKYVVKATKEVILCAGALASPKILMLSGIGPKDQLTSLNIETKVNLPVGENLQDKYGALVGPFFVPPGYSFNYFRDVNVTSTLHWLTYGKGLIGAGRTEAIWALTTNSSKSVGDNFSPNIHAYVISFTANEAHATFGQSFNFAPPALKYFERGSSKGDTFFQLVTLSRPKGSGSYRIVSKDSMMYPKIDPKYLENEEDVKTLVEGIKFSVKIVEETESMGKIGAKLYNETFPGCGVHVFKSDAYFECLARHSTITAYKYSGTVPIGRDLNDPQAVIDSRFRVFGTEGLRVIDGSILKTIEVNTNDITVRMIGELGADVLKNEWQI